MDNSAAYWQCRTISISEKKFPILLNNAFARGITAYMDDLVMTASLVEVNAERER
jgi:hypothetical protein